MNCGPVGVIVVTYNSMGHIEELMESMRYADETPLNILLIDNGSTDGSDEWVLQYVDGGHDIDSDWIAGCRMGENTGFTYAVNVGLKYMMHQDDVEYVALVNPDVILCEDWITRQVPIFTENGNCGIIGCRQVRGEEVIHGGGLIHDDPRPLHENIKREIAPGIISERMENICYSRFGHRMGHVSSDGWNVTEAVPWVTFACALLRKSMIDEIGLLDTRFFNYCSDAEYCRRAWKSGWEVWYTAEATVYHHVGASEKHGDQSITDRKIADLRLFAQEEDEHGSANRT